MLNKTHRFSVALYLSSTSNHNQLCLRLQVCQVALYLSSTSNHNQSDITTNLTNVALYLSSTSNHNQSDITTNLTNVALYLSSTSNHNVSVALLSWRALRYIFLLHQTTTFLVEGRHAPGLRYIFLLHQTTTPLPQNEWINSCVISFFYIKPQLRNPTTLESKVALYLSSTSNHN